MPTIPLFRFPCPQCHKVLKAPIAYAGKRGTCPGCQHPLTFPTPEPITFHESATSVLLSTLIAEEDNITFDDTEADRLSMLLSQGTCRDYTLATKLLDRRPLSARQWRRLLNSAAARENMRLHIEEQLAQLAQIPDDDEEPAALLAAVANDTTDPDAWKILVRFLYFLRHHMCRGCRSDITGMNCVYVSFETFLHQRHITPERTANWQSTCVHLLGL